MRMFPSLESNKCSVLQINYVVSFVLMVSIVKTVVFWVVTLCSLWGWYWLFRGTCTLQERWSIRSMGGGEVMGPVVNRKCENMTIFSHAFSYFQPIIPIGLIRLYPLSQSHGSDWPSFLQPFFINRPTSSPGSLQCHLEPNPSPTTIRTSIYHLEICLVKRPLSSCLNINQRAQYTWTSSKRSSSHKFDLLICDTM
jgi:hypothetical protein